MKRTIRIVIALLIMFCLRLSAQTPITTWYIIPPTSGCNGVWAIDASQAGCGSTYIFNPGFPQVCGSFTGVVADTMYISLCFLPCSLDVVDQQAVICGFCGTGTQTGVEESAAAITTTYPNPATVMAGWNIMLRQPGENVTVNIYNSLGQLAISENHSQADQIVHVDISALVAGTYTAQVSVNGAVSYSQQLVVTQ